jgi:hypothetical protein
MGAEAEKHIATHPAATGRVLIWKDVPDGMVAL